VELLVCSGGVAEDVAGMRRRRQPIACARGGKMCAQGFLFD